MGGDHNLNDPEGEKRFVFRVEQFVLDRKIKGVQVTPEGVTLLLDNETTVRFQPEGANVRVVLGWPKVPLHMTQAKVQ